MTREEVFDKVAIHLLKQGKKSMSPIGGGCVYRGPNGLACAIGCLIPDDKYIPDIESFNVDGLMSNYPEVVKGTAITDEFLTILQELQVVHDCREVSSWSENLGRMALEFELPIEKICAACPNDAEKLWKGKADSSCGTSKAARRSPKSRPGPVGAPDHG